MDKKIMLVDDHKLFIEGLKYLLETYGMIVAGIAEGGKEAIQKNRELKPDIILLDIKMPEYSGLEVLKIVKAEREAVKVIMLTASEDDEDLFKALKFGASGYLLKNLEGKELVDMLKGLECGEVPLSQGLTAKVLQEFQRMKQGIENNEQENIIDKFRKNEKAKQLSKIQMNIIRMISKGKTYRETANNLHITERTVKYHMGKILNKLHLENRAQVIAYAARKGFTEKS